MYCINSTGLDRTPIDCQSADALYVFSRVELGQLSPFNMDIESGLAISGAILMLWAVAFLWRTARKLLESPSESVSES